MKVAVRCVDVCGVFWRTFRSAELAQTMKLVSCEALWSVVSDLWFILSSRNHILVQCSHCCWPAGSERCAAPKQRHQLSPRSQSYCDLAKAWRCREYSEVKSTSKRESRLDSCWFCLGGLVCPFQFWSCRSSPKSSQPLADKPLQLCFARGGRPSCGSRQQQPGWHASIHSRCSVRDGFHGHVEWHQTIHSRGRIQNGSNHGPGELGTESVTFGTAVCAFSSFP